jgi:hypothetical protein
MSIARHHNEWLSLVPHSGPFLSLPVLCSAFPQGLDAHDSEHARNLRMAFGEWEKSHDGKRIDPNLHNEWVRFVLKQTLGYEGLLAEGQEIPQTIKSDLQGYRETVRPDLILIDPETKKARILIQVYPKTQSLTKPIAGSSCPTWADGRMMQLLKDTGIRLGIVTNGEHWLLVNVKKDQTTGYASWYSTLWQEEPITLRAFRTILGSDRLFSVPADQTLEALLDASANDQQEVTDQLGYQVRKAVEVVIQALDKADQEHHGDLLRGVSEKTLYESALTVMMRLVFLFCAEERELLPHGDDLYDKNYAVSTLREQLRVTADQFGEEILGLRHDAWCRLLTTFRAVYAGLKHDRLRLPAYGGSLFNPDRFPFLEGRKSGTTWRTTEATPLPINNRTVLHILEALQVLQTKVGKTIEARSLSFRALDIEQIGHVYEGLLDHTAKRATEPVLGLSGTRDKEPEITLAELEKLREKGEKDTIKFLKEETGRSDSALKKGLETKVEDHLAARFRTACQDTSLWERVKPFAGLVRLDNLEYPVVINTGSVFVTSGTDRRSSGTHYTPRSLTEPIVQYTLEPLVYIGPAEGLPIEQWKLRSAKELLDLRICDMACGSGAFLVQVCRYLAARLLEAWEIAKRDNPGAVHITPEGQPSTGSPDELLIPDDPDERHIYALRIVAQRCIYGVDINPLAVEMAKLSLWLLTLSKDKPFEFLDHAIRCGDSLVGIHNLDQLRKFNLDGKGEDTSLFLQFLDPKIKEAIALRRQITEMQAVTVEDVEAQDRMLREANEKIDRLKCAADFLIAAEFTPGSAADKRAARDDAAIKVALHFNDSDLPTFRREAQKALNGQVTFHWPFEFPEVLVERGGFDGFVGNPPFMGGQKITGNLGEAYREYLVQWLANEQRGSADLCAYFFLRAKQLLRDEGQFGFLATNTIAQGDTREVGLDQLTVNGYVIPCAIPSRPWPGAANLEVAIVWVRRGAWNGQFVLDDKPANGITASLTPLGNVTGKPHRLATNTGRSFQGSNILGMGFTLPPEEAQLLISHNATNSSVLFPFLNADDLNSRPDSSPSRWVINFQNWPLSRSNAPKTYSGPVATDFPDCLRIVEERVKPERAGNNDRRRREVWWQFTRPTLDLYEAVSNLAHILVGPITTKYWSVSVYKPGTVFSHAVVVFALSEFSDFSVLQSSIHDAWAREYSGSLETRLRYTPTDCFENFPFPANSPSVAVGETYENFRRRVMLTRQEGLTETYNRFHNPSETSEDIQKLRDLHVEMDNAVAAAYGWSDLKLDHGFHETKQGIRYTISEPARRDVLQRLLKLNHERYAEEVKQGLHEKKKGATKSASPKKSTKTKEDIQGTLFDLFDDKGDS